MTEWGEPQAVFGSYLQKYAYPDFYKQHVEANARELKTWRRGAAFAKGLDLPDGEDCKTFHAGTALADDKVVTSGGRVLCVVAGGATVAEARERAYDNVRRISFEGAHYRTDIAARADEPLTFPAPTAR